MSEESQKGRDKVLVVEDDPGVQSQMKWALSDYDVLEADNREKAIAVARHDRPKVVLLDLGMPPDEAGATEGLRALEEILSLHPATKVIVASGNSDRANAVKAVRLGAYDFCAKPVDVDVLKLIIERAFHVYDLETDNLRLSNADLSEPFEGVIAASPQMMKICRGIEKVAPADVSVLITGESGTGKEVLANALHKASGRADGPFIAINCAAIPENLLESELFGHERGAFTGAVKQTVGKIELADKGTLFLDEIGDMPISLQAKMLRFIQERCFERIGGRTTINVDIRIVSATNMDLKKANRENAFREDLFFRLNEIAFEIPPLRDRDGDALLLAKFNLQKLGARFGKKTKEFSAGAIRAIEAYDWPGNVRELENKLKRAVVLSEGQVITQEDLDLEDVDADEGITFPTLRQVRDRADEDIITRALALTDDNVSKAAKLLGVSRPTMYELMKSLGIKSK